MRNIKGILVKENVSLENLNTYKIKAEAKYLINIENVEGLVEVLTFLRDNNIKYFILGAGSNVIMDDYFDGAIIKFSNFNYVNVDGLKVTAGAGTMMGQVTKYTVDNNLTGLEWAINIPGTIGGSIVGNAGAYNSEIFDNLVSIKVLDKNLEIKEIKKKDIKHEYRSTNIKELGYIVLEANFQLKEGNKADSKELIKSRCDRRKETQPLDKPTAGSVFRNPEGDFAGRLIEEAGLKGRTIGGAQISQKHANFIVNNGGATSNDIKSMIKLVQDEVKKKHGISLVVEQEILDWK